MPWEVKVHYLHSLQPETGSGKGHSSQRGRSSRFLRVLVHTRIGKARGHDAWVPGHAIPRATVRRGSWRGSEWDLVKGGAGGGGVVAAVAAAGEEQARCGQCMRWRASCRVPLGGGRLPVIMQRQVLQSCTDPVPQRRGGTSASVHRQSEFLPSFSTFWSRC